MRPAVNGRDPTAPLRPAINDRDLTAPLRPAVNGRDPIAPLRLAINGRDLTAPLRPVVNGRREPAVPVGCSPTTSADVGGQEQLSDLLGKMRPCFVRLPRLALNPSHRAQLAASRRLPFSYRRKLSTMQRQIQLMRMKAKRSEQSRETNKKKKKKQVSSDN